MPKTKDTEAILGYFISSNKHEILDVNAHNWVEQEIIKHPREEKWVVPIMPGNQFIKMKAEGKVLTSLPDDWRKLER